MTSTWQSIAADTIRNTETLRLMSGADLRGIFDRSVEAAGAPMPTDRTFHRWVERISAEGKGRLISKVQRDLYRSEVPGRYVHPNEFASRLRNTAVVSLQSVLGEAGIINNPSRIVFSIIKAGDTDATRRRVEEVEDVEYRFFAMRDAVYEAGVPEDCYDSRAPYPKATPERALCDWIYLAASTAHGTKHYPPLDADLDELDMDRLYRLADAMKVREPLDEWIRRREEANRDESFSEQVSTRLGF